ncbi:hypothetical protein IC229_13480 [Spirosoma sp. BT702]|uniref:Uncharacterized protein n=1 Tax=Spirosoma profusum TaxID=2771354 RepID=A0A926XX55_9BACT|nr:hypothetical protein [Spirosoma profusum]MBD2701656.1 hypothetical protein [Spirosoma profusum]
MKVFTTLLALLMFSLRAYGQEKKAPNTFPTYQQIKPASKEIIDYAPAQGKSFTTLQSDLFNYPENSVTYVLNAQPTKDKKYVKDILKRKDIEIETILIERPDADGKRRIIINFSPR